MSRALVQTASRGMVSPGLGVATAGAAAAGAIASGHEKESGWWVPDGFAAVRTRFNRAVFRHDDEGNLVPVVLFPGFHPNIPFSHANRFISLQDRVSSLGNIAIQREGQLTLVHAVASWGVVPDKPWAIHSAWLRVREGELAERFTAVCGNAFNIVMSTVPVEDTAQLTQRIRWNGEDRAELDAAIARKKALVQEIAGMTQAVALEELTGIGLEIRGLSIRSDAPHPFTQIGANSPAVSAVITEGEIIDGPLGDANGSVVSIA